MGPTSPLRILDSRLRKNDAEGNDAGVGRAHGERRKSAASAKLSPLSRLSSAPLVKER